MTQVLFVDDEPLILRALERVLRIERGIQTLSCTGGAEALALLDRSPVDVVISDLHMPGMDGIALLEQVRRRHPGVARFVLSGYSNHADTLRAAGVAHQFLAKPVNSERLRRTIGRVMTLRAAVAADDARAQTTWLRNLPSPPRMFGAITMALEDRHASTRDIAALVETDPALSAKVLQVVNGAYFGLSRRLGSVERAVRLLGTNVLRALVLAQEVFLAFPARGERVQEHSMRAASLARRFAADRDEAETAFTAALLHDVGRLVLLSLPSGDPDADHDAVGASLLALWGLGDDIVDAVAHHHHPELAPPGSQRLAALVHVADVLEMEAAGERAPPLALPLLEQLGLAGSLDRWRGWAGEL